MISLTYKNVSYVPKTFYGVEFKPGETHTVKGFINDPAFVISIDGLVQGSPSEAKPSNPKVESTDKKVASK